MLKRIIFVLDVFDFTIHIFEAQNKTGKSLDSCYNVTTVNVKFQQ
jgi:hypothetical protein